MDNSTNDKTKLLRKITLARYSIGVCFGYLAGSSIYNLLIRNYDNNTAVMIDFIIKIALIILALIIMLAVNKTEKVILR